jgi:hypothetical protein
VSPRQNRGSLSREGHELTGARHFHIPATDLNAVLAQGAQTFGFRVAEPPFAGHRLCPSDPYVRGPGDPAPLHPTAAGELTIALADKQVLPEVEGLVPAPSPSPSLSPGQD